MSLTAKPDQLAGLKIGIRDFGNGPCLATESNGATIVLMCDRRKGVLVSCDADGLLSSDAALPILDRIATLWNADVRARQAGEVRS